jgi:hypothetical protein
MHRSEIMLSCDEFLNILSMFNLHTDSEQKETGGRLSLSLHVSETQQVNMKLYAGFFHC